MQDGVLSIMGRVLKLLFNKPTTAVIHGLDITYDKYGYQKIIPPSLRAMDHVFCISNAARDQLVARDVEKNKVSFIPIGISDSIYTGKKEPSRQYVYKKLGLKDQKPHIILSVGRLVKRKGVEWFSANVMNHILKQFPNTVFVVTGDGDYRTSIEETIKKKKLESNVMLLGRVDEEYRNNLYNGADLFVMPNIHVEGDMEGFGLVLLEASLCKLPVVATGIEGIKDAIKDNKNGVLVKSKDKKAFLNQVTRFLSDPSLTKEFGKKSREFTLKEYDWTTIANRYIKVYKSLLVNGK
jgi:phosphatidylinositol alpha-1,6-mannosyltransferase